MHNLTSLTALSDSPTYLFINSGPCMKRKQLLNVSINTATCMSFNEKENIYVKEKRKKKQKNLLLIRLVPSACLFSLGVIYASKIKAILCSKHYTIQRKGHGQTP